MWRLSTALLLQGLVLPGAMALDLTQPESLKYDVYWSFVRAGVAQLDYVPTGNQYVVRAWVKDDSSLIDLEDSWETRGIHTAARPFVPKVYHVTQAENSYRADKTMTFDPTTKTVAYVNHLSASDKADPLVLSDARDVMSTIYSWRLKGDEEVQRAATVEAVSLKRSITILREAGVRTTLKVNGQKLNVWRVTMHTRKGDKPGKDTWTVYLRDDATMVPVQITAATKFGTFQAILKF